MPLAVDLAEVSEPGVDRLNPAARGSEDLAGERREADGNRDRRRSLAGRTDCGLSGLPRPSEMWGGGSPDRLISVDDQIFRFIEEYKQRPRCPILTRTMARQATNASIDSSSVGPARARRRFRTPPGRQLGRSGKLAENSCHLRKTAAMAAASRGPDHLPASKPNQ